MSKIKRKKKFFAAHFHKDFRPRAPINAPSFAPSERPHRVMKTAILVLILEKLGSNHFEMSSNLRKSFTSDAIKLSQKYEFLTLRASQFTLS